MIAHRVTSPKKQSNYQKLAKYIMRHPLSENSEHDYCHASYCNFEDRDELDLAILEIEKTQSCNTRATDKNYHLVVSFQAGEAPTHEQLKAIEQSFCESLGYDSHQRISALHQDTKNQHLHIAINKVHPLTHHCITPIKDFFKLDECCERLEEQHGLLKDNRINRNNNREKDPLEKAKQLPLNQYNQQQTFKEWLKEQANAEFKKELQQCHSWQQLQGALAQKDLTLRLRGNGLVISARNSKAFTKASDLGRVFSKGALEKRLGAFEGANEKTQAITPTVAYQKQPLQRSASSADLWAAYQQDKLMRRSLKEEAFAEFKREALKDAWMQTPYFRLKRFAIRENKQLNNVQKRPLYQQISAQQREYNQQLDERFGAQQQVIFQKYAAISWPQFLMDQAVSGSTEALQVLREKNRTTQGQWLGFKGKDTDPVPVDALQPQVDQHGTVSYHIGDTTIQDQGDQVKLNRTDEDQALLTALHLAIDKYGPHLDLEGTDAFREKLLELAVANDLEVIFADEVLEQKRQLLMALQQETSAGRDQSQKPPPRKMER